MCYLKCIFYELAPLAELYLLDLLKLLVSAHGDISIKRKSFEHGLDVKHSYQTVTEL